MGKCYTVSFDSLYAYKLVSNNAGNLYYVNWSALMPDKPYKVSFSCITATELGVDIVVMGCMINLGNSNSFTSLTTSTASNSFLGFLELKDTGNTHYYLATQTTNPPVYINGRPDQTILAIQFTNGLDYTSAYSTPSPGNYILTLHFEEQ